MNEDTYELFEQLFRFHYPVVVRQILQLVGNQSIAEDLAQEVFMRLYRQPPNDLSKAGPWLHRTLTRLSYDHLEQVSRQRSLEQRLIDRGAVLELVQPSSEQTVLQQIDSETVQRALFRLSERDRKALILKYSGYNYNEMAEMLHVNSNTVATLLLRAMTRLRRQYEKEVAHDREQHDCL